MIKMRRIVSIDALCRYLDDHETTTSLPFNCSNLRVLKEDIEFVYKGKRVYTKGTLVCYDALHKESQDVGCKFGELRFEDNLLVTRCANGGGFTLLNIERHVE